MRSTRDFRSACSALSSLLHTGIELQKSSFSRQSSLSAMRTYLEFLGFEDLAAYPLPVVHIAGTKGKGSTAAYTESILRRFGLKTGLFTSPHLVSVTERFRINGAPVSEDIFSECFWKCWDALSESTDKLQIEMPGYFRYLTLMSFMLFQLEKVDVLILEVGVGGRLDPTNVIPKPVVTGIASLGFDHCEVLGSTIEQIAAEKAGIFKPQVPAYSVPQPIPGAKETLVKCAEAIQVSNLTFVNPMQGVSDYQHKQENAGLASALAFEVLRKISMLDPKISLDEFRNYDQVIQGIKLSFLEGRCDKRTGFPPGNITFYLDGAHTKESMKVCTDWYSREISSASLKPAKNILFFNCIFSKDPVALLSLLAEIKDIQFDYFVCCPSDDERSTSGKLRTLSDLIKEAGLPSECLKSSDESQTWQETLANFWSVLTGENGSSEWYSNFDQAWERVGSLANQHKDYHLNVLVTGSLYLVGNSLKRIQKDCHRK